MEYTKDKFLTDIKKMNKTNDRYEECLDVISGLGHTVEITDSGKLNIRVKEAV